MATFDGSEGKPIDPQTGQRWINNYQATEPFGIKAELFGKKLLEDILKQPGCVGMRIYYAKDDFEGWRLILVGTDAAGKNLWPVNGGPGGIMGNEGWPCPPVCPE